ncbi:MAG: hypothetical protein AMJ77_06265 [Dehalococcoidia bacterium SM23_28_2]|nr:MAG: hypothetical protein AMJ77_06265 [Dehalococcoidia bacterium SM23_28_2]
MNDKPVLVVQAHIDPDILPDFEQWYLRVHLRNMFKIPGISAAFRVHSSRPGPNWMTVFLFSDEAVIQKALASKEASQARQDWERWLPHASEISVEVYASLRPLPAYRHWN